MQKNHIRATFLTTWLALCVFFTPTNLFVVLSEKAGYSGGLFIDYLLPKLYVVDLVLFIGLAIYSIFFIDQKKILPVFNKAVIFFKQHTLFFLLLGTLLSAVILRQFFTNFPITSLWQSAQILLTIISGFIFYFERNVFSKKIIYKSIIFTIIFQCIVALWQSITQENIFGFYFFGEPNLASIGVATWTTWWGEQRVLPYGTTPHPNILAGIMAGYILLILRSKKTLNTILKTVGIFFGLLTILLCGSISAIVALTITASAIFFHQNKIKNVLLPKIMLFTSLVVFITSPILLSFAANYTNSQSITRRSWLNSAAIEIWQKNSLFGTGIQNFTTQLLPYVPNSEWSLFLQPVHHTGLLVLAETGVLGWGIILLVLFKIRIQVFKNYKLILVASFIVIIGSFDHYLHTLRQGQLLLLLLFVL